MLDQNFILQLTKVKSRDDLVHTVVHLNTTYKDTPHPRNSKIIIITLTFQEFPSKNAEILCIKSSNMRTAAITHDLVFGLRITQQNTDAVDKTNSSTILTNLQSKDLAPEQNNTQQM